VPADNTVVVAVNASASRDAIVNVDADRRQLCADVCASVATAASTMIAERRQNH